MKKEFISTCWSDTIAEVSYEEIEKMPDNFLSEEEMSADDIYKHRIPNTSLAHFIAEDVVERCGVDVQRRYRFYMDFDIFYGRNENMYGECVVKYEGRFFHFCIHNLYLRQAVPEKYPWESSTK